MTAEQVEDAPFKPGDLIGTFEVQSFLARGGMGVLLRAVDVKLDRPVALKIIDPKFADDGDFRARFERECKVLAKSSLGERTLASPAVLDPALIVRTESHLYRFE